MNLNELIASMLPGEQAAIVITKNLNGTITVDSSIRRPVALEIIPDIPLPVAPPPVVAEVATADRPAEPSPSPEPVEPVTEVAPRPVEPAPSVAEKREAIARSSRQIKEEKRAEVERLRAQLQKMHNKEV